MNRQFAFEVVLLLASVSSLGAQTGTLRIRVTDPLGTAVQSATSSLLDASRPVRVLTANDAGEILWTELPLGDCHFRVTAPGFSLFVLNATIRSGVEQNVEAALKIACLECVRDVETTEVPNPKALDLALKPQPKPAKRRWWQIFR